MSGSPEDCAGTREAHESAIAKLCETLARMDRYEAGGAPRADVVFLNAQVIRHRISLALIDALPARPRSSS